MLCEPCADLPDTCQQPNGEPIRTPSIGLTRAFIRLRPRAIYRPARTLNPASRNLF